MDQVLSQPGEGMVYGLCGPQASHTPREPGANPSLIID